VLGNLGEVERLLVVTELQLWGIVRIHWERGNFLLIYNPNPGGGDARLTDAIEIVR